MLTLEFQLCIELSFVLGRRIYVFYEEGFAVKRGFLIWVLFMAFGITSNVYAAKELQGQVSGLVSSLGNLKGKLGSLSGTLGQVREQLEGGDERSVDDIVAELLEKRPIKKSALRWSNTIQDN